jgi:hypothetical protein
MTVKTTTAPKAKTTAAPVSGHGCCGGDAAPEPQNKNAKPANPAVLGHAKPSKAAETCCCGDAGTK